MNKTANSRKNFKPMQSYAEITGMEHGRTKSIPNPSAQTNTLCLPGNASSEWIDSKIEEISKRLDENNIVRIAIELTLLYGLRISEILSISINDCYGHSKVLIRGKKGSENRIIDYHNARFRLGRSCSFDGMPFSGYTRFFMYREFKRWGVVADNSTGTKKAVTHAGRHLLAQSLKSSGANTTDIKNYYGHKNENNTKLYTHEKKD